MWFLVNDFYRQNLKAIEGDIIVDDLLFDDIRFDKSRESARVDRAFDSPVGAMSFNWNSVNIFIKPAALTIRLFANMAAGHIIVISLIGLIFVFKSIYMSPVSIAFTLFIDILECLVALLQAYIFTMLTALFIGASTADHNHDGAHTSDDETEPVGH